MREYDNEDDILLSLLDTNEKQRGTIGGSTIKLGRRIKEYERIYGIKQGGDRSKSNNVGVEFSQEDLLKKLDLNKETYRQAKKLASLPPEIQEAVETERISPSTASRIIAALPEDQQVEVVLSFPATDKITKKKLEKRKTE